jgi:hypothetical protein
MPQLFGLPMLSWGQAIAVNLVFSMLVGNRPQTNSDRSDVDKINDLIFIFVGPIITLIIASIVHSFI